MATAEDHEPVDAEATYDEVGDDDNAAVEDDGGPDTDAPTPEPTMTSAANVPNPTSAPPPEPDIIDQEAYAQGLLVDEYSAGASYARYARPRANPAACNGSDVANEIRGRDRLRRVVPSSFTHGGYRSTTGQTSRFAEQW